MIYVIIICIFLYVIDKFLNEEPESKNDEMDCRSCLHQTYQPFGRERCLLTSIDYPYMKVGGCKRYKKQKI